MELRQATYENGHKFLTKQEWLNLLEIKGYIANIISTFFLAAEKPREDLQ